VIAAERPESPVLQFLGGAGTVTGSRFLVDTPSARVLVDCGLFQGLKPLRQLNWRDFPVDPATIDAVAITHAHLDHTGYLPRLVTQGFAGPVLATRRTSELSAILLPDSGRIHEEDARYANRKGFSRHRPALPLYTEEDAVLAAERFEPVEFGVEVAAAHGVAVEFRRAGHILGSASVTLGFDDGTPPLHVSGDLGRSHHPILLPPEPPPEAGTLLIESTYGDRRHPPGDGSDELAEVVAATAERRGAVVIPAFSVDRTETVLLALDRLMEERTIPELPVYVDSPLALEALGVYRRAVADGDSEVHPELRLTRERFAPPKLVEARTVEQSKQINDAPLPAVIISASGMAAGGRVLHHLARRLPDPASAIVLVGFQATGTRGHRLMSGEPSLKLLGRYIPVRARVVAIPHFSVHADQAELIDWVASAERAPEQVFAVHGEPEASATLAALVRIRLDRPAAVPSFDERVRL
jgi:metallo-beta-lactamase family protein